MGVFKKGKKYTCIYNDQRAFTVGKEYTCLSFEGAFHSTLMKDDSHVKFMSDEGNVNTMFGSIAVNCFTDDPLKIESSFAASADNWYQWAIRESRTLVNDIETCLKSMKRFNHSLELHAKFATLLGRTPRHSPLSEHEEILLNMIVAYKEETLLPDAFTRFLESPEGVELRRKYSLEEEGTWHITINGYQQFWEGKLENLLEEAVAQDPKFKGDVRKIEIRKL